MAPMLPQAVHKGMRVFAGADEIGKVTTVWGESFEVTRGLLNRHVYVIPNTYVVEVGEDVVDLTISRQEVDGLEVTSHDGPIQLPDEYRRAEGIEDPTAWRVDEEDILFRH